VKNLLGGRRSIGWMIVSILFLLAFSQLVVLAFGFASINIDYFTGMVVSYFFVGLSTKYALNALFTNGQSIIGGDITEFGKVVIFTVLMAGALFEIVLLTYAVGYVLSQFGFEVNPQVIIIGITLGEALIGRLKSN